MSDGDTTWNFTYNSDGIRTKRTNGTTTYTYVYNGSQLAQMTVGNDTLSFTYDAAGIPLTVTHNGAVYYYSTNLQGDVVAILDSTGTEVVRYAYDAWGYIYNISGTLNATLGVLNPLRYRGYVYDHETELYYLQSRYYDPWMKRFINADMFTSTGQGLTGNNMFAYCGNNPASRADPNGQVWRIVIGIALLVGLVASLSGCSDEYKAAPEYVDIPESEGNRDTNPNCYSYAIGIYDRSYDPGDFSEPYASLDVFSVAVAVKADLNNLGREVRIINGPTAPIKNNEYRIALRVSEPKIVYFAGEAYIDWDYHFMVQTNTGCWAEKHGPGGATVYHPSGNPNTISWDSGNDIGYYTSPIIYFAITNQ